MSGNVTDNYEVNFFLNNKTIITQNNKAIEIYSQKQRRTAIEFPLSIDITGDRMMYSPTCGSVALCQFNHDTS